LACPASALPDWDSDEGWIDVLSAAPTEAQDAVAVPAEETTDMDDAMASEEQAADLAVVDITMDSGVLNVVEANCDSVWEHNPHQSLEISVCYELPVRCKLFCNGRMNAVDFVPAETLCLALFLRLFPHSSSSSSSFLRISLLVLLLPPLRHVLLAISWQVQLTNTVTPRREAVTLMEKNPDKVVSLAGRMESTVDAESIREKVVPRRQKPAVGLRRVGDFRESKCLAVCFARWLNPAQSTYRQDANVSTP
jgi:hypothetical protein